MESYCDDCLYYQMGTCLDSEEGFGYCGNFEDAYKEWEDEEDDEEGDY